MSTPLGTRNGANSRDSVVVGLLCGGAMTGVVLTLLAVYALPEPVRRSLAFEYADPTIGTAYTAHFVHFAPSHLAGNLAAFLLVGGVLVGLSIRTRDPWLLVGAVVTLLVVVPASLSFLNLAIPRNGVTYGFSGLNMALAGFLPVAVVRYAECRFGRSVDSTVLLAMFFLSVGYVGGFTVPRSTLSTAAVTASGLLGVVFAGLFYRVERESARPGAFRSIDPSLVLGIGVWIALLSVGFPDARGADGGIVNVYVHFLGYALGFTVAYLAHELGLVDGRPQNTFPGSKRRSD